jgi:hypothetical protein
MNSDRIRGVHGRKTASPGAGYDPTRQFSSYANSLRWPDFGVAGSPKLMSPQHISAMRADRPRLGGPSGGEPLGAQRYLDADPFGCARPKGLGRCPSSRRSERHSQQPGPGGPVRAELVAPALASVPVNEPELPAMSPRMDSHMPHPMEEMPAPSQLSTGTEDTVAGRAREIS